MDSNHRSVPRQIYSLLPLATREPTHIPMLPRFKEWSWRWDLNPQPADYKSAALPIELRQPILRSTATPFSIRLQMPHCVGNDIYYTRFPGIVNTLFCLVLCSFIALYQSPCNILLFLLIHFGILYFIFLVMDKW